MDAETNVLEDTSETLSPLGEKLAPVLFVVFLAGMGYLVYRDPTMSVAIRVFGWLAIGAGVLAALYTARSISRARRSVDWPVVEATVTRSQVFTTTSTSVGRGQAVSTTMHEHYPSVWYEYEVQGQRYRSKRIIFLRTNYTRGDAEAAVARYPLGQRVKAFYSPANPKLAVLEPGLGANAGHYDKGYFVGAFFAAVGLLFAYGIPWAIARLR